ncbi:MMPL family transporter [Streptomyces sp. H27-H1]|uniref:MMPL family transporter n=1 Tax=Streptomyces sp. H27-H1 TaxID=2996461 RepID=UPI00226E89E2|nr:MMPL family transporter [Streptomyces sp. H27-H1]MCY0930258.1 MMPL family transporter [Streptomyces sp. H27-H1]
MTTFLVLFLMTGSLLLPAKAMLLNALSMGVTFGVLVWIFQEGNLADLFGFTPSGSIEPSIPILMFCVAFGLFMDYEVFMLSRIMEEYDLTGDNTGAVAAGLERSGPLITSAAVILTASVATYASSEIVFLKTLGIGMVVVILVDATLIRAVLVPVSMRLAGKANWWAPGAPARVPRPVRHLRVVGSGRTLCRCLCLCLCLRAARQGRGRRSRRPRLIHPALGRETCWDSE